MLIARVSMTASPPSHRRLKVSHAKASCASTGKCRTPGGVPSASATSTYGAPTNATGRSGLPAASDFLFSYTTEAARWELEEPHQKIGYSEAVRTMRRALENRFSVLSS